jgi:hypothetical protein
VLGAGARSARVGHGRCGLVPIKAQLKAAPAKRITVGASERRCDGCKVKRMFNYMSACMLF